MKIKQILLLFCLITVVLSCKNSYSHIGDKNANYIPYYLKVYKADSLYKAGNHIDSFAILDSLFKKYEPIQVLHIYEIDMYLELMILNKIDNDKKVRKLLKYLIVKHGYNLSKFNDKHWVLLKEKSKLSTKKIAILFKKYKKNLNYPLIDSLSIIFEKDQFIRKKENNLSDVEKNKIQNQNQNSTIFIIKKHGFPLTRDVGGYNIDEKYKPSYFSILLKHIDDEVELLKFQPFLLNEVKIGRCPPVFYAGMLDNRQKIDGSALGFPYYGTYSNIAIENSKEVNIERKKIGLPILK